MKKILCFGLCIAMLTGCAAQTKDIAKTGTENQSIQQTEDSGQTDSAVMKKLEDMAGCMEKQIPQITYTPMDLRLLEFYTESLKDEYDFYGRFSNLGYAYIIGICKEEKSSISGLQTGLLHWEFSRTPYNESYVKLGNWTDDEQFEEVYRFPGVSSLFMDDAGKSLYLGISQPDGADIGKVFDHLVNNKEEDYLNELSQKNAQMLPPVDGAFLQLRKWEHGTYRCEYIPVSNQEFSDMTGDGTDVLQMQVEPTGIELFTSIETWRDGENRLENLNGPVMDFVKEHDLFCVQSVDEIKDIAKIEYIPDGQSEPAKIIEDADAVDSIEKLLQASVFTGAGDCPYTDLLVLTKKDGSKLELQLAADSCDGFILGSYACYTPGKEAWEKLKKCLQK